MSSAPLEFEKGLFTKHPIFHMTLGLCTALAVSILVENAIAMGLATIFVLVSSNLLISLLKDQIPKEIELPTFLVIIGAFVTFTEITLKAFLPQIHKALGIYLPLIAVNCIVLARVQSFAARTTPKKAVADGLGMGIGYAYGILIISFIRELFGNGSIVILGRSIFSWGIPPTELLVLPPGGFIVMGLLLAVFTHIERRRQP
ncbi:MAG TPA: electron transport complex subunit RsxE [Euryarchaeota archaeon]|nr:electron transport complex protein RnfE [archaeon BMS3Abin16]GBE56046.1 electron transport complex protein RnfE [archaeon BMS3Bbin16]HDH28706.1 electron transport complex subunit RsxE [Euryarchaeota archaeon]